MKDPTLPKGKRVVESAGSPPRSTSVHRVVYAPNGEVMYDSSWSSRYVGEESVVRVGTKPPAKKKPKPAGTTAAKPPAEAPTSPTPGPAPQR